jgi:hypothetical protein
VEARAVVTTWAGRQDLPVNSSNREVLAAKADE